MRKLLSLVAAGALVLGVAGTASAVLLPFSGAFSLQIGSLAPVPVPGTAAGIVNGSGGGTHVNMLSIAGGTFAVANLVTPVTDPTAAPIAGVIVTAANGGAAFAGMSGGMGGGIMPIQGGAKVCLFGSCFSSLGGPGGALANLVVPFTQNGTRGVGIGGGGITVKAAVNITVTGAPWTQGTVAIGSVTAMGFGHGPASGTSTTAAPSGVVQLVTPVLISTNIGSLAVVPAFGILNLHFIPEPGTLLLLGSGVVGLGILGRKRMKK